MERKVGNNIYIYDVTSYWDSVSQKTKKRSVYIGKKDNKTGEVHNAKKLLAKFADDFGARYFFKKILSELKIESLIKKHFPDSFEEIIEIILFQNIESKPSYLMEYSYSDDISSSKFSSQNMSRLFNYLGKNETKVNSFLKDWIDINKIQNSLFYDITSISSYSRYCELVEWGHNRDCEQLPQVNFGILFGNTSKLPLLYKIYSGSISDVTTLKNLHQQMEIYGFKKFVFCLDRGFYSASNLSQIYLDDFDIIIPMPFSTTISNDLSDEKIVDLENMININGNTLFYKCFEIKIGGKKYFANVYLNESRKLRELNRFSKEISLIEKKFAKEKFDKEEYAKELIHKEGGKYKKYFKISKDSDFYKITKNTDEMQKLVNKMGKVILITKNKPDSKEYAINSYLYRDEVEKVFDVMKNEINENRLRVSSADSVHGRLFITFIVLICMSFMTKIMKEKKLFNKLSINEVISELKKLKIITMHEGTKILCELTKKQKDIFLGFKIPYPDLSKPGM